MGAGGRGVVEVWRGFQERDRIGEKGRGREIRGDRSLGGMGVKKGKIEGGERR